MADYLRKRKGIFYFRYRIPTPLLTISTEKEIFKSLKTRDYRSACLISSGLRFKTLEVFTLARHGYISEEQARDRLLAILDKKPRAISNISHTVSTYPTLSHVIAQYTLDHESDWTIKTKLEYKSYFKLLKDIIHDRPIDKISRDTVRDLRDTLSKLPPNLYKKFPDCSIKQILLKENIVPMSITTVNKLIQLMGSLMRHSIQEGHISVNPVEGLKLKQNRRADEERKAYSIEDIKKIVSSLPTNRLERYWIPLISMYSGMRLGEACSLNIADIKQTDGIWCFDLDEDKQKRLKTQSSRRVIPIHPVLITKGLLELFELKKSKGEIRLWSNLQMRETDGYCSAIGKWYQRFNRQHVTKDPQKTFHSLRHSFADTLKQLGVQEVMIAELMGHASGSITMSRYGKRYKPEVLLEVVQKIDYELMNS